MGQAVRYCRLAADQNNARAKFNLGVCYAHGTGVAKDEEQAGRYYCAKEQFAKLVPPSFG